MKMVEKWKYNQDTALGENIVRLIRKFWSPVRRKDFLTQLILRVDFTIEELEELSNLTGQEAHRRARIKDHGRV